jgi:hypothetical protein
MLKLREWSYEDICLSNFLPPLYVGKATNLRERMYQHAIGINSNIKDYLESQKLEDLLVLFHWMAIAEDRIATFESLAIQLNRPSLNRQLE